MRAKAIGVDIGGTSVKLGVLGPDGTLERRRERSTPHTIPALVELIAVELQAERSLPAHRDLPIGVAVPGIVDEEAGVLLEAVNLGWRDAPVRDLLAERIGPLTLCHDVRAGAIAESRWCFDGQDLLFVPLGTGIAAALVVDGRPWGTRWTGEIGQVYVPDPDGSGRLPLEQVASATALARRYAEHLGRPELAHGGAELVLERLRAGDPVARSVFEHAVAALADVLAATLCFVGPVKLVIGGGMSRAGDDLLEPLRRSIAERLRMTPLVSVEAARLGSWAGCVGAATLACASSELAS